MCRDVGSSRNRKQWLLRCSAPQAHLPCGSMQFPMVKLLLLLGFWIKQQDCFRDVILENASWAQHVALTYRQPLGEPVTSAQTVCWAAMSLILARWLFLGIVSKCMRLSSSPALMEQAWYAAHFMTQGCMPSEWQSALSMDHRQHVSRLATTAGKLSAFDMLAARPWPDKPQVLVASLLSWITVRFCSWW